MKGILYLLIALGLTWAVECTVALIWFKKRGAVWAVFLVNMLTNPLINVEMALVAYSQGLRTPVYWAILAASELAVVAVEGILLSAMLKITKKKALLFSLIANVLSYFTGVLLEATGIL
jgi:hypothetical protein